MGKWLKLEDWIFWAHWGFVLREITRIWSQHLQTNLGNTCVGTILMQPLSLNIRNTKDGITHCGKQGEGRQCSPLGRVLGLGSAWLSCRDSSSWCDPYCHRSSASGHQDGGAEWSTEGAWDKRLFPSTYRPERTCPGQASCAVSRLGLIYVVAELAALKGSYVILLCGKIGEGGMERKRVNNRAAPGMSRPLFSTAWASRDARGGTGVSESLMSDAWS